MSEAPFSPYSPGALRALWEARRRRRRRQYAAAASAAILAASGAVALVLIHRARHPAAAAASRRFQAAIRPELAPPPARMIIHLHPVAALVDSENQAIDRLLERQPFITAGGGERREIALTFDDGPGPYTPRLLNELQRLHVRATFFEIGFMFRWFHASALRELQMGDVIGDHTESHLPMALLSRTAQRAQILAQTRWVQKYGGSFPRLWRPPYGSYNQVTLQILHQLHMLMVLWTADTQDYTRPGVALIVHRALAAARPGAIILMHDAGGNRTQTIAALPLIVQALRARGYQLVTIPQLILDDPPLHPQQLPSHLRGD